MDFGTLTIQHVDGRRETLNIDRPTVRIGRDRANDVVLNDPDVSGAHAELLADPAGCQIIDLGSANGTDVDGQRILSQYPQPLSDGSLIRIGGARIVLSLGPGGAQPRVTQAIPAIRTGALLEDLLEQPPAPDPRRREETQPLAPPAPADLRLILRPDDLRVDPGRSATAVLDVLNQGRETEDLRLSVVGLPDWAVLLPSELRLAPGERGEAQLLCNPPKSSEARAGIYQYQLVAVPARLPETSVSVGGSLGLGAFSEFRFELLDPRAYTGWAGGRYVAQIRNDGNLPRYFILSGGDPSGAFRFRFRPEPLLVDPGETRTSRLRARLGFFHLFSEPRSYPFTLSAAPADDSAPTQQAEGRLVQRHPLPPWLLSVLAVILIFGAIGCGLAFLIPPTVGAMRGLIGTPQPTATASPRPLPTLIPTATASPTPTAAPAPPAPPTPIVIVPTVIVQVTVVPPPAPAAPAAPTPTSGPPPPAGFATLRGNPVRQRSPIVGDEYADQGFTLCMYREIPLPAPPGPGARPDDPPQTRDGLTLEVGDSPDPAQAGQPLRLRVAVSNTQPGRRFFGLALTARPPQGAALAAPGEPRCQPQPDGSLRCELADLGPENWAVLGLSLTPGQAGEAATSFELTALFSDDGAPAETISLAARTATEIQGGAAPVADCGMPAAPIVQRSLAARSPQSFLLQVPPVIYPPGGPLAFPHHALTTDAGPDHYVGDMIGAITFERPVSAATLTVYFTGPAGNYLQVYGLDPGGQLVASFRSGSMGPPGLYHLPLRAADRPLALLIIQNVAVESPEPLGVSAGGLFIVGIEAR